MAAELYLTRRAEKQLYGLGLTQTQAKELHAVFKTIREAPLSESTEAALPISSEFRKEGYLGDGKHVAIYYDVRGADPVVRVVAVKVFYKM